MRAITDAAVVLPFSDVEAAAVTRSLQRLQTQLLRRDGLELERPLMEMLRQLNEALSARRSRLISPGSPASPGSTRRVDGQITAGSGPGERWSAQQVADRLGLADDSYVRRQARSGKWAAEQDGRGRWWFSSETVDQLLGGV